MAAHNDWIDSVVRDRRRGGLAGAAGPVAMAKRPQQTLPDALEALARDTVNRAARWLPRSVDEAETRAQADVVAHAQPNQEVGLVVVGLTVALVGL